MNNQPLRGHYRQHFLYKIVGNIAFRRRAIVWPTGFVLRPQTVHDERIFPSIPALQLIAPPGLACAMRGRPGQRQRVIVKSASNISRQRGREKKAGANCERSEDEREFIHALAVSLSRCLQGQRAEHSVTVLTALADKCRRGFSRTCCSNSTHTWRACRECR